MTNEDQRPKRSIVGSEIEAAKTQAAAMKITPATTAAMTKPQLFDAVRRAGDRAKELDVAALNEAAKTISDRTRGQYARIIKRRLIDTNGPDMEGVSRASWYPTRAAIRAGLADTYRVAKRDYDKASRAGDMDWAVRCIQMATKALDDLEAISRIPAPAPVKVQQSARQHLPKSVKAWQARVYQEATMTMKPAIAVMWATGCRPAELEQGVDVYLGDGGALRVRIPGAKVCEKNKSGQPVRVLEISKDSQAGKALLAALDGKNRVLVQRKASRISKDFLEHIRPKLPKGWQVSAYSFRHQASANLKADLGNAVVVARALGHQSTRSQQHYGTKGQRQSGGGAVLDAKATHQVRETRGLVLHPPVKPSGPSLS